MMQGPTRERWQELCAQAAEEQDPEKLLELVKEINRLHVPLLGRRNSYLQLWQFLVPLQALRLNCHASDRNNRDAGGRYSGTRIQVCTGSGYFLPSSFIPTPAGRESLPNTPSWEAIFLHDPAILKSTFQVAFPGKQVGQEPARPVSIQL